jgi:hypothetical protein
MKLAMWMRVRLQLRPTLLGSLLMQSQMHSQMVNTKTIGALASGEIGLIHTVMVAGVEAKVAAAIDVVIPITCNATAQTYHTMDMEVKGTQPVDTMTEGMAKDSHRCMATRHGPKGTMICHIEVLRSVCLGISHAKNLSTCGCIIEKVAVRVHVHHHHGTVAVDIPAASAAAVAAAAVLVVYTGREMAEDQSLPRNGIDLMIAIDQGSTRARREDTTKTA